MKIPFDATYRCLAFEADGRWITGIARSDLRTGSGNVLSSPREGSYDPAGLTAPSCRQSSLEAAVWHPAPPDVLVVASCEELDHIPPVVIDPLPVIVIALAGQRIWRDVPSDLGKLCHEREIVAEPSRDMTPLMLRAWQMARIVEVMLQSVWVADDLIRASRTPQALRLRKFRHHQRRSRLH